MTLEERETVIIINDADLKAGYFRFQTSKTPHYRRLLRAIGGEAMLPHAPQILGCENSPYYIVLVPIQFLSAVTFGLKRSRSNKGKNAPISFPKGSDHE